MATTTHITNIADKLDLTDYAGDFIDDFDMDAVHTDYVSMLNCDLPDGITLLANGDVIAELPLADQAREIDWDDLTNERNVEPIFERHARTAGLLADVSEATNVAEIADRKRVAAVRKAKESGRYTVEEIARAAGITRDGIYKMLSRATRVVTLGSPEQASYIETMPQLLGAGHLVDIAGSTVTLTAEALDVLAELDEDVDGHYDGTHIWISGSEYLVEG